MSGSKRTNNVAFEDDPVVTLTAGNEPDVKSFQVHRSILLEKITHFEKVFGDDAPFAEKRAGSVHIDDASPKMMRILWQWFYGRGFPDILPPEKPKKGVTVDFGIQRGESKSREEAYHGLIALAEMWLCSDLAKDALECLRKCYESKEYQWDSDELLYNSCQNLGASSQFRAFLLDYIISQCIENRKALEQHIDRARNLPGQEGFDFVAELLARLVAACNDKRTNPDKKSVMSRNYYKNGIPGEHVQPSSAPSQVSKPRQTPMVQRGRADETDPPTQRQKVFRRDVQDQSTLKRARCYAHVEDAEESLFGDSGET